MKYFCGWMRPPRSAAWVAFICALLGVPSSHSQISQPPAQQAPPRPIIRAIDVEYNGPATVSKERILAYMRTKVGDPFNDATVQQGVEPLKKSGPLKTFRFLGDQKADGVKVIVQVQTRL